MAPRREITCLQAHSPDWNAGVPAAGPLLGKCSRDFIGSCERLGSGNKKDLLLSCGLLWASVLVPLNLRFLIHMIGIIRELCLWIGGGLNGYTP